MMNKEMMKKMMVTEYNRMSFTHEYIMGYVVDGIVYASFSTGDMTESITTLDKASSKNGGGYSLRFKPNKGQKQMLMAMCETFALCSKDFFENEFKTTKYNRGEIFEKLVAEHFGQSWEKDNVPFTKGADLTVDGIGYQLKFEKATYCTEKSLISLAK